MGTFCCFEVTIGIGGSERVDYITYDTKGIWRCYEVKVSKSDFYSKAKVSFVGHYNYYVMPRELYEEVKDDIPKGIGVIANGYDSIKRAGKQKLSVSEKTLKDSMIRSLYREAEKLIRSEDESVVQGLERRLNNERKSKYKYMDMYNNLLKEVIVKFGTRWDKK